MIEFQEYISNAVKFCMFTTRGFASRDDVVTCLKTQNSLLHSKFRYSIARDIAAFIFDAYGDLVKNLKLYGSTMEYTAGIYSDIDLVIQVNSVSSEFLETLKQLNSLLSQEYYQLLEKDASEWSYLLDIHIINDDPNEQKHPSRAYLEHILYNDSVALTA